MTIHYTSRFIKDLKKLGQEKQKVATVKEGLFRKDPFDSRLKTHKLLGVLKGYWAFSLTYSDRVLFRLITKSEVIFYKQAKKTPHLAWMNWLTSPQGRVIHKQGLACEA